MAGNKRHAGGMKSAMDNLKKVDARIAARTSESMKHLPTSEPNKLTFEELVREGVESFEHMCTAIRDGDKLLESLCRQNIDSVAKLIKIAHATRK